MSIQSLNGNRLTLADRMALTHGHPSGFDYIRLFLATEVLVWHTIVISYGITFQNQVWAGAWRAFPALILPMFFALSGFLVAGSLERTGNVFHFLCLRFLRVFPALCCVVSISALCLGPFVTSYSLGKYFSDPQFASYFRTLLGDVRLYLPGVFEQNPFGGVVNGQLWTIPLEMLCYVLLGVSALIGVYRRRSVFLAFVVLGQILFAVRAIFGGAVEWSGVPTHVLFLCFFAGSALNVYRTTVPFGWSLALLSGVLSVALIFVPHGGYFVAGPVAYLTVYLGLLNPRKTIFVSSGDYSYGIYLYAFPVQQFMAAIGPQVDRWYFNLMLSLPVTFFVAVLSWHLLEKHALAFRHNIPAFIGTARHFYIAIRLGVGAINKRRGN